VLTTDYPDVKRRLGDEEVIVPDPTPADVTRMMARHRAQLTELLTRYGKIDMLCLDCPASAGNGKSAQPLR
jgi:alpha-L-fucosidase